MTNVSFLSSKTQFLSQDTGNYLSIGTGFFFSINQNKKEIRDWKIKQLNFRLHMLRVCTLLHFVHWHVSGLRGVVGAKRMLLKASL